MNYQEIYRKHRGRNPDGLRTQAGVLRNMGLAKNRDTSGRVPQSVAAGVRALLAAVSHLENGTRKNGSVVKKRPAGTLQGVEYARICEEVQYYSPADGKNKLAFTVLEVQNGFRPIACRKAPSNMQMDPVNHISYATKEEAITAAMIAITSSGCSKAIEQSASYNAWGYSF